MCRDQKPNIDDRPLRLSLLHPLHTDGVRTSLEGAFNSFRNINFNAFSTAFTHQTLHSFSLFFASLCLLLLWLRAYQRQTTGWGRRTHNQPYVFNPQRSSQGTEGILPRRPCTKGRIELFALKWVVSYFTSPLNNSIIYLRCCLMDKSLALHSFDVYFPEKMH